MEAPLNPYHGKREVSAQVFPRRGFQVRQEEHHPGLVRPDHRLRLRQCLRQLLRPVRRAQVSDGRLNHGNQHHLTDSR